MNSAGSTIPKAQIKVWDSLEINGFIFVWNHLKGDKPNWFPEKFDTGPMSNIKWEKIYKVHIQVSITFIISKCSS